MECIGTLGDWINLGLYFAAALLAFCGAIGLFALIAFAFLEWAFGE